MVWPETCPCLDVPWGLDDSLPGRLGHKVRRGAGWGQGECREDVEPSGAQVEGSMPAAGHRPGLLLPPTPSGLFSEVLPWRCLWGPLRPSLPRQQLLSCTQACLEPVSLGAAGQVWAVGTGSLAPVPTGLEHATVHCSLSRYWVG